MQAGTGGARLDTGLRIAAWAGAAMLFLLPVIAQQTWNEMDWGAEDFITWGMMLLVALGLFELTMRSSHNWSYRFGAAIAIGAAFLLVWVNLAVGIIGGEDNAANLMYGGVLAVGAVGAVLARFKPRGMVRAMTAMAVVTVLAGAVGLLTGSGEGTEPYWFRAIVGSTLFWGTAWLVSAALFQNAARQLTGAEA